MIELRIKPIRKIENNDPRIIYQIQIKFPLFGWVSINNPKNGKIPPFSADSYSSMIIGLFVIYTFAIGLGIFGSMSLTYYSVVSLLWVGGLFLTFLHLIKTSYKQVIGYYTLIEAHDAIENYLDYKIKDNVRQQQLKAEKEKIKNTNINPINYPHFQISKKERIEIQKLLHKEALKSLPRKPQG